MSDPRPPELPLPGTFSTQVTGSDERCFETAREGETASHRTTISPPGSSGSHASGRGNTAASPAADASPLPVPPGGQGAFLSALEQIAHRRQRQIEQFGHTPEQDLKLRATVLPARAIRSVGLALEDMQFQRDERWRDHAKQHLADAGAFICAAWDFIDNGGGQ